MTYSATIYRVFIASPSDVVRERAVVSDVIHHWNTAHSADLESVLLPVKWETHASPRMGDRPQALINKQVVHESDILVGIFRTRLGTPTGEAESGTVEEIKEFRKKGKPVLLYFSSAPILPVNATSKQFTKLNRFKKECLREGLVSYYKSIGDLRDQLQRHLLSTIRTLRLREGASGLGEQLHGLEIPPHTEKMDLELQFWHPVGNQIFTAYVNPLCTGQQAVQGLMAGDLDGPFLESNSTRTYELMVKRSQQIITSRMTFEQAGVVNGDVIEVLQSPMVIQSSDAHFEH
jgi:hypothetical protein